ncbi:MAG: metallophosphoesterase, partial [Candidatus Neomarinimicrobiota bacterium]
MSDGVRYIIVGDLHGNYVELESLLAAVEYNSQADRLIFTGDYNDHFQNSNCSTKQLIDLLIQYRAAAPEMVTFIRGNHDQWFADWLADDLHTTAGWFLQGGLHTLKSYGITPEKVSSGRNRIPAPHRQLICHVVQQYYCDERLVAVHGGFTREAQMEQVSRGGELTRADQTAMIWDREFIFKRDSRTHRQYRHWLGERYLVTGHSPSGPWLNPVNEKWLLIDSP